MSEKGFEFTGFTYDQGQLHQLVEIYHLNGRSVSATVEIAMDFIWKEPSAGLAVQIVRFLEKFAAPTLEESNAKIVGEFARLAKYRDLVDRAYWHKTPYQQLVKPSE